MLPQNGDKLDMAWIPASARDQIHALYTELDEAIRRWGPVCELSGRCCRFAEFGHTLFVSAPEFAILLAEAPPPVRPIDDGASCPWQDERGHCTARSARPLGCRVYYCDPSYQDRGQELSEVYIGHLKGVVEHQGLSWQYAPLHHHLHRAVESGLLLAGSAAQASTPAEPGQTSSILGSLDSA